MKSLSLICLALLSILFMPASIHAKGPTGSKTTIILMRHAEKELTATDPPLSAAGLKRAAKLPMLFKAYKPDEFYCTPTTRTRQTLTPWAKQRGKEIQTYYADSQETFANQLKRSVGKTIVVAGHSNTIPLLVNLLLGTNTYTDLPDNEFGTVFIVSITKGKASVVVKKTI